jgi:hypothetical protein
MTVRNTNYSSLEEVWGDLPSSSKQRDSKDSNKRKERKDKRERTEQPPKVVDPICELYEMGNYRGYNENDIINFANDYHDKYLEKDSNRAHNKHFDDEDDQQEYREYTQDHEKGYEKEYEKENTRNQPMQSKTLERNVEQHHRSASKTQHRPVFEEDTKQNEFAFIDLLLYIVSGIILIFVMEQFVKIGLLLQ